MAKRKAEFIISAKDEASKTLNKVGSEVSSLGGIFGKLGKIAGPALAGFVGAASLKGIFEFVRGANDMTGAIEDSSIRLGIGINQLIAFQRSAKLAGVEAEGLDGLITKLNKTAGEIKLNTSSEGMIAAFDRIGISVQQVKKSDPADLFKSVIAGLGKIEDPAVRASTAMQIFGKSGAAALVLVADGAEGLSRSEQFVKDLGLELSDLDVSRAAEANDAIEDIGLAATLGKQKLAAELSPAIAMVANMLLDAGKKGGGLGEMITSGVNTGVHAIDRLISAGSFVGNSFGVVWNLIKAGAQNTAAYILSLGGSWLDIYGTRIPGAVNDLLRTAETAATRMKQGFYDFATSTANAIVAGMNKGIVAVTKLVNVSIDGLNGVLDLSNKVAGTSFQRLPQLKDAGIKPFQRAEAEPVDFGKLPTFGEDWRDWLDEQSKVYQDAQKETMQDLAGNVKGGVQAVTDLFSAEGGALAQGYEKTLGKVNEVRDAIHPQGGYGDGNGLTGASDKAEKKIKSDTEKMADSFNILLESGQAVTHGLERAIDDFARSGKFSFANFAASALQDISAILAKSAILGGILGNSNYGGSGSLLGFGSTSSWGQTISGFLSGFSGAPKAIPVSYDGGGFTGSGSRSGGVDGKGGFPAILHPNETVLDHTRGQGMSAGNSTVNQTIIIREVMPAGQARAIQQASINGAIGRMQSINERGGKQRQRLLGRR